jgi:protein TonB
LCGGPLASCAKALGDGDIVALARIQPTYPRRAALRGIEGFVIVEFTITDSGTVINPRVVEAQPRRMFEQAALRSIVRWRFKPKVIDGNAISRQATQRLEFRLDSGAAGL